MANRGFGGLTTVGATPQPVYGTTTTAAAVLNPDFHTGQIGAGNARSSCVLSVANAYPFRVGDRVAVGTAAQFEQNNATQADGGTVTAVSTTNGTITVQGLQRAHGSGEFVLLALPVSSYSIQLISGTVFISEDANVSGSSSTVYAELTAGGIDQYGLSNIANVLELQHLWISGVGATFYPSLLTV